MFVFLVLVKAFPSHGGNENSAKLVSGCSQAEAAFFGGITVVAGTVLAELMFCLILVVGLICRILDLFHDIELLILCIHISFLILF